MQFKAIDKAIARKIVETLIIPKATKIFEKRNVKLHFDENFIDYVLQLGYDKQKGVRNLEKQFERLVTDAFRETGFVDLHNGLMTVNEGTVILFPKIEGGTIMDDRTKFVYIQ